MKKIIYKVYEKCPKAQTPRLVAAYSSLTKAIAVSRQPNRYILFRGSPVESLIVR